MLLKSYFSSMKRNNKELFSKCNNYFVLGSMVVLMIAQPLFAQMNSSQLKEKILSAIEKYYHESIKFDVTVTDPGDVTIKGSVSSYWDWRNVLEIVSHVDGVIYMREQITVNLKRHIPDNIIKAGIQNNLKYDKDLTAPDRVQVAVQDGVVKLTGTLLFARVVQMVVDRASWQEGVRSVINEIKLIPPPHSDVELTTSVRDMIDTYFPLQKKTVQLEIENGQATLTGSVKTLWVKNGLEREVKQIAGISGVQNDIKVTPSV